MSEQKNNPIKRKQQLVQAIVASFDGSNPIKVVVKDAKKDGCTIVSSHVRDLPDKILLKVPHVNGALKSQIVWRGNRTAELQFI